MQAGISTYASHTGGGARELGSLPSHSESTCGLLGGESLNSSHENYHEFRLKYKLPKNSSTSIRTYGC